MSIADNIAFEDEPADQAAVLADRLLPLIGAAPSITRTLTELVTAAREWACLEVEDFNTMELDPADAERRDELAVLMDQAVGRLPDTDEGPIRLDLNYGDIRGVLVRLVLPEPYQRMHTTWAADGIGVES